MTKEVAPASSDARPSSSTDIVLAFGACHPVAQHILLRLAADGRRIIALSHDEDAILALAEQDPDRIVTLGLSVAGDAREEQLADALWGQRIVALMMAPEAGQEAGAFGRDVLRRLSMFGSLLSPGRASILIMGDMPQAIPAGLVADGIPLHRRPLPDIFEEAGDLAREIDLAVALLRPGN